MAGSPVLLRVPGPHQRPGELGRRRTVAGPRSPSPTPIAWTGRPYFFRPVTPARRRAPSRRAWSRSGPEMLTHLLEHLDLAMGHSEPVVASSTRMVACGAVSSSFLMTRTTFCNSGHQVCPCSAAARRYVDHQHVGVVAPCLVEPPPPPPHRRRGPRRRRRISLATTGTFDRSPQTLSCSTAAAGAGKGVSPAASTTERRGGARSDQRLANLPMVVGLAGAVDGRPYSQRRTAASTGGRAPGGLRDRRQDRRPPGRPPARCAPPPARHPCRIGRWRASYRRSSSPPWSGPNSPGDQHAPPAPSSASVRRA